MEKQKKVIEGKLLARSTPEAVLPESNVRGTVTSFATSINNVLLMALITLKVLQRSLHMWMIVAVLGIPEGLAFH